MSLVSNKEGVYIDGFTTAEVDIADINNLNNTPLQASQVAHILSERLNVKEKGGYDNKANRTEAVYNNYHYGIAMQDEAKARGEAFGIVLNDAGRSTKAVSTETREGKPVYITETKL